MISPLRALAIGLLQLYRYGVSPILPRSCRFSPSCSAYALEAVRRYGAVRGGWLGLRRLLRCHPWGDCGDDPVPDLIRRSPTASGVPTGGRGWRGGPWMIRLPGAAAGAADGEPGMHA